eukprot:bmy_18385T0
MSEETVPEAASPPSAQGQQYFDRFSEDDPEYLRLRNRAADLRQDFNLMEQKKRVTMILQSPAHWEDQRLGGLLQSFREELEGLIQEQMKKGNNSSNIWALRQIADFMASTSHAVFPTSSMSTWGAGELPGAEVGEVGEGKAQSEAARLPAYAVSAAAAVADLGELRRSQRETCLCF